MMKPWEKLIALLDKCSDNSEEAAKLYELARITQSKDYQDMSSIPALKQVFNEYYSIAHLQELELGDLKNRRQAMEKVYSFYCRLTWCIRNGNGPELAREAPPDFLSEDSIKNLSNMTHVTSGKINYTNINNDDVLLLFSKDTINTAEACLNRLPVSLAKKSIISESDLSNALDDTLYCINIEEFQSYHRQFLEFVDHGEQVITKEAFRRKRHRYLKLSLSLVCFGLVYAFRQFGLITESYALSFSLIQFVTVVLYLIWG